MRSALFRETRHRPLERVRVRVDRRRQERANMMRRVCVAAARDMLYPPIRANGNGHRACPSIRQKRLISIN